MFYIFLRRILPNAMVNSVYNKRPGITILKLPSFSGQSQNHMDSRGWTYVHNEEALEMLIVRLIKSLTTNLLGHLANSTSWLMEVFSFRCFRRYIQVLVGVTVEEEMRETEVGALY